MSDISGMSDFRYLKASPMPPAPPDYRIFRLFRISRNSVFSGIIGGIWGSGGFPLDWNRLGDSFRRSFSPNSGIWTQFDPFSMISDVLGLSSRSRIHEHMLFRALGLIKRGSGF